MREFLRDCRQWGPRRLSSLVPLSEVLGALYQAFFLEELVPFHLVCRCLARWYPLRLVEDLELLSELDPLPLLAPHPLVLSGSVPRTRCCTRSVGKWLCRWELSSWEATPIVMTPLRQGPLYI